MKLANIKNDDRNDMSICNKINPFEFKNGNCLIEIVPLGVIFNSHLLSVKYF